MDVTQNSQLIKTKLEKWIIYSQFQNSEYCIPLCLMKKLKIYKYLKKTQR